MHRSTLNFVVDVVTLLVTLAMVATGLLLKVVLPPGSRGGRGLQLFGLGRHDWGDLHFALSVALGALLVLHIILHWAWVCSVASRLVGCELREDAPGLAERRHAYGAGFLAVVVVLLAAFLWVATYNTTRLTAGTGGETCACGQADAAGKGHGGEGTCAEGGKQAVGRAASGP